MSVVLRLMKLRLTLLWLWLEFSIMDVLDRTVLKLLNAMLVFDMTDTLMMLWSMVLLETVLPSIAEELENRLLDVVFLMVELSMRELRMLELEMELLSMELLVMVEELSVELVTVLLVIVVFSAAVPLTVELVMVDPGNGLMEL